MVRCYFEYDPKDFDNRLDKLANHEVLENVNLGYIEFGFVPNTAEHHYVLFWVDNPTELQMKYLFDPEDYKNRIAIWGK